MRVVDIQRVLAQEKSAQVARNKRIGQRYEKTILSKLGALRVPFSGAGQIKGDGLLQTPYGTALVECKYQTRKKKQFPIHSFSFDISWVKKLVMDTAAMRARFGMLVFHVELDAYHYALIPAEYTIVPDPPVYLSFNALLSSRMHIYPKVDLEPACREGCVQLVTPYGNCHIWDVFVFMKALEDSV